MNGNFPSRKHHFTDFPILVNFQIRSFRIIYRIKEPEQIELIAIGPRERIYEETFRMIQKKIE